MRGGAMVSAVIAAGCAGCHGEPPEPPHREPAPACPGQLAATGAATYYDATGAGSCSLEPAPSPSRDPAHAPVERMVAALNAVDYDHAAWCGACLAVEGPLGDVVVRVVDRCPGCKHGDLDLSREAFAAIAPLSDGRTKVAWRTVACPVTGAIGYQIKPGSNASWAAFQLRNHRYPIARLEARDAGGGYRAIARGDDNYFVARGLGPGPYALRVSDIHGHALEDTIAPGDGVARPGAAQFPACP
ncbi:MAG TPA: expansin EXLX1 family cellulose-binding protein [Kofleriaceae bacterium]|jgi:expansin (peptidoglycan-binding protein)